MAICRFLALSLLLSAGAASVAAQSSPNLPQKPVATPEVHAAPLLQKYDLQHPVQVTHFQLLQATPQAARAADDAPAVKTLRAEVVRLEAQVQKPTTCFAMRSYNFTPSADAPVLSDSSTCQPSTQLKRRDAVVPLVITPR